MKTLFRNLLITGLTLTTLNGFSNEIESAKFANIIISLEDVKPGHKLSIKNEEGAIIYKEVIKETGEFKKNFDLEALPDGSYVLEIEKDYEIVITPISIVEHKVKLLKANSYLLFKPVVRLQGDKLLVSKLNFSNEPIKLELLYDEKHGKITYDSLYSETIRDECTLERIYELDPQKFGTYKIVIKSDNRTFIKEFKI